MLLAVELDHGPQIGEGEVEGERSLQTQVGIARDAAGLPEPRQQGEAAFAATVEELAAFVRDRGREPEAGSGQPAEAKLGSWLDAQRRADRKGRLSAERSGMLETALGQRWSSGH